MAKKEKTPEQKAEKKAKSQEKKKTKRVALVSVLNYVRERKNVPDEVLAAAKLITPGQRVAVPGVSRLSELVKFFQKNKSVTEAEIFGKFKMGRGEMRKICVNLIKKQKPADRIWVRFDADKETYLVAGTGDKAPADWAGYRPVEVDETEIV